MTDTDAKQALEALDRLEDRVELYHNYSMEEFESDIEIIRANLTDKEAIIKRLEAERKECTEDCLDNLEIRGNNRMVDKAIEIVRGRE